MALLTLLRHGQSLWNRNKRFTGWSDIGLSEEGRREAERAGRMLAERSYQFDCCFSSELTRATETLRIVLDSMACGSIPTQTSWHLNERHYGALQGLGRWAAVRKYGPLPMINLQRKYTARPPLLDASDPRYPGHDPRYAGIGREQIPCGESLEDTLARLLPYWQSTIAPTLRRSRHVLIVAHRNSLKVLRQHLDQSPTRETPWIKLPTGKPLTYELDEELQPLRHYYVEDGTRDASTRRSSARPGHALS